MMNRDAIPRVLLCLTFTTACGLGTGCNALSRQSKANQLPTHVVVEREDHLPPMTPAEQARAFRVHYAEGVEFAGRGQYEMALSAFELASRIRPDSTEAMFNLAACYDAIGDPMRAIGIYRELLQITPEDPDCYANLGTSFIKMYHRENSPAWRRMAREAWEQSLRLNPEQPNIRAYLAQSRNMD